MKISAREIIKMHECAGQLLDFVKAERSKIPAKDWGNWSTVIAAAVYLYGKTGDLANADMSVTVRG